jgi:hypothetical protein
MGPMNIDDPVIIQLREQVKAAQDVFDMAVALHEVWKPAAEPVLAVSIEDFVAGFARDAEGPTDLRHGLSVEKLCDNRRRSSMTEQSFHGINTSRQKAKSVTHVSGTTCHLCLRPLIYHWRRT